MPQESDVKDVHNRISNIEGFFPFFQTEHAQFMAIAYPKIVTIGRNVSSLATVMSLQGQSMVTEAWIREQLGAFDTDDVFERGFLEGIIFTDSEQPEAAINHDAKQLLTDYGVDWIETIPATETETTLWEGPCALFGGNVFQAWKLYRDTQGAFVTTVVPKAISYEQFSSGSGAEYANNVAVPSRLRWHNAPPSLLQGLRIAVKDNFCLTGIKRSLCNKAYHELYGPSPETAACIESLVRGGADVLGTTKLASFAATEEPIECIDFQAPWNPRADGYQSPAGSSSGSGVAIASYGWLDIAVGSDTSGSGRRPGHWNGCFATRPSHDVLPLAGFKVSFRPFDVPTFFGRDLETCRDFAKVWYGECLPDQKVLPPSIIVPTDYMSTIQNDAQIVLIDSFIADLEISLGTLRCNVSLEDLWNSSPPPLAQGAKFAEYMEDACRHSFWYDDFHNLDKFRADYKQRFSKEPYVSPPVRWQWNIARSITQSERDVAFEKLQVYKEWFLKEIMRTGVYNTIVVLPIEEISPRYRDEPPKRQFFPIGVPMLFLSPIIGGPELTIPIGQVPYQSKISGREEHLPVGISLLAEQGMDMQLFNYALSCLKRAGRHTAVLAGKNMFSED